MLPPDPPQVSIVIAAYNEGRHIRSCLETLLRQDCRRFEIIVIDDGSKAPTHKLASSFRGVKVFIYRLVWDTGVLYGWLTRKWASAAK